MPDLQQFRNKEKNISTLTPIAQVAAMNVAFGNPKGDFDNIDYARLKRQCRNLLDEYVELWAALHGYDSAQAKRDVSKYGVSQTLALIEWEPKTPNVDQIRDSLCDIQVFAAGAQHFMGVNGDDDMTEVVGKVMTRFVKDAADLQNTIAKHALNGVTDVYFEGEYPTLVVKSASDQPDAPKGKFLKSASFSEPTFIHPKAVDFLVNGRANPEARKLAWETLTLADSLEFVRNETTGQTDLHVHTGGVTMRLYPDEGHVAYHPV